jgi:hypothetical protein
MSDIRELWRRALAAMDNTRWAQLQQERFVSSDFCQWAASRQLLGWHKGGWAFPVHDDTGRLVALHVRGRSGWYYSGRYPCRASQPSSFAAYLRTAVDAG